MTKRGGLFYVKRTEKSEIDNQRDFLRWYPQYPTYDPDTYYPGKTNPGMTPTKGWSGRRYVATDDTLRSSIRDPTYPLYMTKIKPPIGDWDVSRVTNMSGLFAGMPEFNEDIRRWNVSNVTNMNGMFHGCVTFNQDIRRWNVAKVSERVQMFQDCPIAENRKPQFPKIPNPNSNMKTLRTPKLQSIEESNEEGGGRKKRSVKRRKNRYSRKHNVGIR